MFTRIRNAWRVLWSKVVLPERIYVYPAEFNPNKFVQLLAWRDTVLALDTEGKIWELRPDGYLNNSGFVCQFLQESTRSY